MRIAGAGSAAWLFSGGYGRHKPVADASREVATADFIKAGKDLKAATDEVKSFATKAADKLNSIDARMTDAEQRIAERGRFAGYAPPSVKSIGMRFVESEEFKALAGSPGQNGRARLRIETKAISSASTSAGGAVAPDYRPEIVALPQRRLVVRDLLAAGQTSSNTVYYVRQTGRTNNAATVAENPSAAKPQSDATYINKQAPVTTIAHFIKASRQIMDDAPALASQIDNDLRYGLSFAEEQQLLLGDGTGTNLLGLIPQATPFARPAGIVVANPTAVDTLLFAIA